MDLLLIIGAALWGGAVGLLVPRPAHRFSVAPDEPWQTRCPEGHLIGGWVGLARCRDCGGRMYGPSTPLVALATALVCGVLAAATGTRPELVVWLLLAPLGVLLAVVDFTVQRLPDVLTLPLAGAALILLAGAAAAPEHAGNWLTALYGSLALGGGYFLLFLINPNGMGFGDVKLSLGLGAVLGWYGWGVLLLGTFAGFLFGGLYGLGLVIARRAGRKTSIPFGPFLITGAFVGLLVGAYAA
ncbi:A24 family peptidase [Streptomyces sp. NBC_00878]|uniref:prepilin peptidase n=1 Tax=Streptomyces sp. NBC_00878 TaxID=2975854 RepID=UPI00224F645C|nr:A24 family peptidase [Streptomyces sp. NBC_00878]MCX4907977.1 A24 family peptidase [Streptomyces sp. NBC_00878]